MEEPSQPPPVAIITNMPHHHYQRQTGKSESGGQDLPGRGGDLPFHIGVVQAGIEGERPRLGNQANQT